MQKPKLTIITICCLFVACLLVVVCLPSKQTDAVTDANSVNKILDKLSHSALSEEAVSKNASISGAVEANNAFGLDLYRQLAVEKMGENLFFSPYSVLNALTMLAEGARGHTAEEMKAVMRLPEELGDVHNGLSTLKVRYSTQQLDTADLSTLQVHIEELEKQQKAIHQREIRDHSTAQKAVKDWEEVAARINELLDKVHPTEIAVANALWGEKMYPFKQTYIDLVSEFYGTGSLRPANFRGSFDAERVRINSWVEKMTHERIKSLLPKGSLNPYTRLVLANAIYFKGEWREPFKKEKTREEYFTVTSGQKTRTLMMKERMQRVRYGAFMADGAFFDTPVLVREDDETSRYPGKDGFSMIELPYRGGMLAMVILAPNSPDGLGVIEKKLDAKTLGEWISLLKGRTVYVGVPKFRLESQYRMNGTLEALGMVSAFEQPTGLDGANFKGMTDTQNANEQLYLTLVQHKAFVAVDEEGTEAAAATGGSGGGGAREIMIPFTPEFRADRPFLFLIRDVKTGCILFAGRMMKP